MIAMQVTILGRPFVGVGGVRFFASNFCCFGKSSPASELPRFEANFWVGPFLRIDFRFSGKKTTLHMYLDMHLRIYVDNRWYRYCFVFLMGPRRETWRD